MPTSAHRTVPSAQCFRSAPESAGSRSNRKPDIEHLGAPLHPQTSNQIRCLKSSAPADPNPKDPPPQGAGRDRCNQSSLRIGYLPPSLRPLQSILNGRRVSASAAGTERFYHLRLCSTGACCRTRDRRFTLARATHVLLSLAVLSVSVRACIYVRLLKRRIID